MTFIFPLKMISLQTNDRLCICSHHNAGILLSFSWDSIISVGCRRLRRSVVFVIDVCFLQCCNKVLRTVRSRTERFDRISVLESPLSRWQKMLAAVPKSVTRGRCSLNIRTRTCLKLVHVIVRAAGGSPLTICSINSER